MSCVSEIVKQKLSLGRHVQIKLIGDSITHGVGGTGYQTDGEEIILGVCRNPNGYCWAKRFKENLESRYDCSVVNNAMSGSTIDYINDHFDGLVCDEDDLIICTVGTNNRHQYHADGPKRSYEQQRDRVYGFILELCDKLNATGKDYILFSNVPASASDEKDGAAFWRILHMDDIDALYKQAQKEKGFHYVSMYDLYLEYCRNNAVSLDDLLIDGLHPNDAGYDVMYELTMDVLELEK